MPNVKIIDAPEDLKPSLLNAFKIFQRQAELLEKSHYELKRRLDNSQICLAEKNRELAFRIAEVGAVKERLAGILEAIADAVFLISGNGKIELANNSALELLGRDAIEKGLKKWQDLTHFIESRDQISNAEIQQRVNGEERIFLISIIPMAEKSNIKGLKVISMKDVTEHRRLQERVAREDRMAALGQVATSVAHEIRNPLCGIEGFAQLLVRDLASDSGSQNRATKIIYAARQLNAVVSNLLNYTREIKSTFTPCDVTQVVDNALSMILPMADDRGITVRWDAPGQEITAEIDSVQIGQVITNLLVNAIEACPRKHNKIISIKISQSTHFVRISIRDNGSGMSPNVIKRIFDPFFTTKDGGIGLGLALCYRIIDEHEGQILCTSKVTEGTTIKIKLPKGRVN